MSFRAVLGTAAARAAAALLPAAFAAACGGGSSGHAPAAGDDAGSPAADSGPAGDASGGALDVTATIDTTARHQTMVGFGASLVYDVNYLADRQVPGDDIYRVLFADLGLDVLRIANWYQNQTETGASESTPFSDTAALIAVQNATAALGHAPRLLMSSWSPPSYLKSSGDTKNGGTLVKSGGAFAYAQFAQWWTGALGAYASNGVVADYISIQNEPDFTATWESCRFDAAEGTNAAYGKALDAVYGALQASGLGQVPAIVGPEVSGIVRNKVQSYLAQVPLGDLSVIAHHLYSGGAAGNDPAPDSFATAMTGVATAAATDGKPVFMTEFSPAAPSMFNTAWMIHDAVASEGVSAYFYWELVWTAPGAGAAPTGLVTLESPYTAFTTPNGYTINDVYYAVKHYSRWVDADWVRVGASSTSAAVKVSAFESPDGTALTVVVLNTDATQHALTIDPGSFGFGTAAAYRTSGATERTAPIQVGAANAVLLPPQSIATVTFTP